MVNRKKCVYRVEGKPTIGEYKKQISGKEKPKEQPKDNVRDWLEKNGYL
jgi:hypothetical protein